MLAKLLLRFFGRLKFPWLFAITAVLFTIDLAFPFDPIPLFDEILLGLVALLLATWKKGRTEPRTIDTELAESNDRAPGAAG